MEADTTSILQEIITPFAGLTAEEMSVSIPFWHRKKIAKGDFYNTQNVVCRDLGILTKGIFRVYYYDLKTEEEKNIFFFSEGQFIVSFASFIYQYPCSYYIEALEDSEILYVNYDDLQHLYLKHKPWERFGRILAEHFFIRSQVRAENLLLFTHEQRYLNLLQEHPNIVSRVASFHIASYLGIKNQSLSRIKKRLHENK